jgi:NTP pyrophosphatase (non-canonical NTP hydrolase)
MNLNEYQKKALRTACEYDTELDMMLNGLMGLNGEAGECIDILKKYMYQGHKFDKEKMLDELGDVLWYISLSAQAIGKTLDEVAIHNIEKLEKRFPEGFSSDKSINREEAVNE